MSESNGVIIKEETFDEEHENLIPLLEMAADEVDVNGVYVKEASSEVFRNLNNAAALKFIKNPRNGEMIVYTKKITEELFACYTVDYIVSDFVSSLYNVKDTHYERNGTKLEFQGNTYSIVIDEYKVSAQCEWCCTEVQFSRKRSIGSEHLLKQDCGCEFSANGIHDYNVISERPVMMIALARVQESCECKNL